VARVTLKRQEDLDYHLVLQSGTRTMMPRRLVSLQSRGSGRARVVGIGFFDYNHGQTGLAPNAIELHPVLGFACLS